MLDQTGVIDCDSRLAVVQLITALLITNYRAVDHALIQSGLISLMLVRLLV